LPVIYRDFYDLCADSVPKSLIGTELLNHDPNLKEAAIQLLEENGIKNFLDDNDVVFMMHQGYQFWYFKAEGNPDPIVYGYQEPGPHPDNFGLLSNFIRECDS